MTLPLENKKQLEQGMNKAFRYLSYQPRTIYEVTTHLRKKEFDTQIIQQIIQKLLELNYLNDHDFALLFVKSKVKYRPKSKFALGYALKKKGVDSSIIDSVLEDYEDEDLAKKSIEPKFTRWKAFDNDKFKKKVMNYLKYRGFDFDVCMSTLDHFSRLKDQIKKI